MPESGRKGWTKVAFGDVVRKMSDRVDPKKSGLDRYVAGEHMDSNDLRIRRWGLIGDGYLGPAFHMRFKPGQVLYGSRRTYLRKVGVPDFEGVTANTTFVLQPMDPTVLLPELLPFVMSTEAFHSHSNEHSKGSVNPYINFSDLASYEFDLPPLNEQRRIAEVLQAVEENRIVLRKASSALSQLLQATSMDVFESDIRRSSRTFSTIVRDWAYGPRFSADLYSERGKVAQLRTTDIDESGEIAYDGIPMANLNPNQYTHHLLRDEDLVMSRSGTCGLTAVFRDHGVPTVAAAFMFRISPSSEVSSRYLHEYFSSPVGRQETAALAQGGVQKNIKGSELLERDVPCPGLPRQSEVVDLLGSMRSAIKVLRSRIIGLNAIEASLFTHSGLGS